MLKFPRVDTRQNYLAAFWKWVAMMAADDFGGACDAVAWPDHSWSGDTLRRRVTTFFGGGDPWFVVVPNERLVRVVEAACEFAFPLDNDGIGWFMALIPVTTRPDDPLDDEIPLMGLAVSFFVRELSGEYTLEHEIFHA